MTTHANSIKAGVTHAVQKDQYGISSAAHVSELGRDSAVLPKMTVAGRALNDLPVLVFEMYLRS